LNKFAPLRQLVNIIRMEALQMKIDDAINDLKYSLAKDDSGAYRLPCRKAFLQMKVRGAPAPFRFTTRDKVRFRIDKHGLLVEGLRGGEVRAWFAWKEIESIAAGEPETDSGLLFQG
jgi:hypothetical protein